MNIKLLIGFIACSAALSGCATSQRVTLAQTSAPHISTVAIVVQDGNSPEMNASIEQALVANKIMPKQTLPSGTRKSSEVDAIVTYTDVWHWDLVMYLKNLTVNLFDARSGNLIVTGRWDNSALHGFQSSNEVVRALVDELVVKAKSAETAPQSTSAALRK